MENTVTLPLVRYEELKAIEREKENKFEELEKNHLVIRNGWLLNSVTLYNADEIQKELHQEIEKLQDNEVKIYEDKSLLENEVAELKNGLNEQQDKKNTILRMFYISSSIAIILLIILIATTW